MCPSAAGSRWRILPQTVTQVRHQRGVCSLPCGKDPVWAHPGNGSLEHLIAQLSARAGDVVDQPQCSGAQRIGQREESVGFPTSWPCLDVEDAVFRRCYLKQHVPVGISQSGGQEVLSGLLQHLWRAVRAPEEAIPKMWRRQRRCICHVCILKLILWFVCREAGRWLLLFLAVLQGAQCEFARYLLDPYVLANISHHSPEVEIGFIVLTQGHDRNSHFRR